MAGCPSVQGQSVLPRHLNIGKQDADLLFLKDLSGLRRIAGGEYPVDAQRGKIDPVHDPLQDGDLIVYD